jgi:hypothetical protein
MQDLLSSTSKGFDADYGEFPYYAHCHTNEFATLAYSRAAVTTLNTTPQNGIRSPRSLGLMGLHIVHSIRTSLIYAHQLGVSRIEALMS